MINVVSVDSGQWSLNEDEVLNEKFGFRVCDYLHGRCHIFALAAKAYYKDRARIVCVIEVGEDDLEYLGHAYTVIDENIMIDARGVITESEIDDYRANSWETYTQERSVGEILEMAHDEEWGSVEDGELDTLEQFVQNNPLIYEVDLHLRDFTFDDEMAHEKKLSKIYQVDGAIQTVKAPIANIPT